jgi:hypothetical protein
MKQPWEDPDAPEKTDAGRLRELLSHMGAPPERRQPLDLPWLAANIDRWRAHGHYAEARMLCTRLLLADGDGGRRRLGARGRQRR